MSDPGRMSSPGARPRLTPDVESWIAGLVGGGTVHVTPVSHYRPLWSVDVVTPDRTHELFVRGARDSGSVLAAVYDLEREAAVIRALTEAGVPTPGFVGFHPDAQVLVLERVPGWGDLRDAGAPGLRDRVIGRFVEVLADLHTRDPAGFGLDAHMRIPQGADEHALGELTIAEARYDAAPLGVEPAITWGRQWLRDHVPPAVDRTSFVQGDTGPGNFVFDDDADVWLVDLEISHFGDPMEDLAAVCIRDMVTPFADLPALFRQYDRLTGWDLDLDRVRYHRVSKCVRSLIAIVSLNELGNQREEALTWLGYRALYTRALCQAIGEAMHLDGTAWRDPTIVPEPAGPRPEAALHDVLGADLADRARAMEPPTGDAPDRALQRDIRIAAVLRAYGEYGPHFLAAQRRDVEALLGIRVADDAAALAALDDRLARRVLASDDLDVLRVLCARADRQAFLARAAMGPMADGSFSPIEEARSAGAGAGHTDVLARTRGLRSLYRPSTRSRAEVHPHAPETMCGIQG